MTDEERARELASKIGLCDFERFFWEKRLREAFRTIRAGEREKCAKVAERDVSAAQARAGSLTFCSGFTCRNIAAAIRAMGDKGNG